MKSLHVQHCPSSSKKLLAAVLALSGSAALFTSAVHAADLFWTATGDSTLGGAGTWDASASNWWDGASATTWATNTLSGDTAVFSGTAGTVTLGANINALGLTFLTPGYTIAGSTFTLGLGSGGIDASALSAGTIAISGGATGLSLGSAQTWSVGSGATLAVSGVIGGTGPLTKSGGGTLTLSGVNTFGGGLNITGGTVAITSNTALGGTSGTAGAVTLDGGTLRVSLGSTAMTNTHPITVGASGGTINIATPTSGTPTYGMGAAGNLSGGGPLTVSGDGALGLAGSGNSVLVLGNANTGYTGNVILQDGAIIEYANANGVGTGGTFTINHNGMLSVNNVNIARDITLNTGGHLAFQNNNNGVFSGNITLNGDAGVRMQDWWSGNVRNGTITGTVTGAHALTINSGSSLGTGGTLTLGGFDAKASSADLILIGAGLAINSNSGTGAASVVRANSLTIDTGNLTVTGVASQDTNDVFGTLNLGGGKSISVTGANLPGYSTWTLAPNAGTSTALTFTNMGTRTAGSWVALQQGATLGAAPGAGSANIYFTNGLSGSDLVGGGGAHDSATASIIPWLRVKSATDNNVNPTFYGYDATRGVVAVTMSNVDLAAAAATANVFDTSGSTLSGDKTVNSAALGGNVVMAGNTLNVTSGAVMADLNTTIGSDAATAGFLAFGSAEAQLSVRNARSLTINSSITGGGGLTYVGFRSGTDPTLVLGGANTFTGAANFYGYGGNTNVRLTNSLALQNATLNHVAGRGYTLTFGNGGTSGRTAYTFGGLMGNANLALANNNTIVEAVALTVGGNDESTTYGGVLSDGGAAGGSLIKTGAGTLTLSGANTYTGATIINQGVIALGAANRISDSSALVLAGGAFATGGFSETLNTLTVSANSVIDFGNGSSALAFADSNSIAWTGTLTLLNFNIGVDTLRFGDSDGALTGAQLGAIILSGYTAVLDEGGFVTFNVIPEPSASAVLAGLAGIGFAAARRRRRTAA